MPFTVKVAVLVAVFVVMPLSNHGCVTLSTTCRKISEISLGRLFAALVVVALPCRPRLPARLTRGLCGPLVAFVGGHGAARCRRCRASTLADTGTLAGTVLALTFCAHHITLTSETEKARPTEAERADQPADQAGVISSTAERGTLNAMT